MKEVKKHTTYRGFIGVQDFTKLMLKYAVGEFGVEPVRSYFRLENIALKSKP